MCRRVIWACGLAVVLDLALTGMGRAKDSSLLGWWKLDEGAGGVATDSSGRGNDGKISNPTGGLGLQGAAWVVDAERPGVLSFSGNDSAGTWVDCGMIIPKMTLTNKFTWVFWAKQDASQTTEVPGQGNDVVLGNRYNGTQSPLQFIKVTPTHFEYYNAALYGITFPSPMPASTWVHHAVVKDGTALTYYRDGEEAATSAVTVTIDPNPFYMGGDGTSEHWAGMLSDVRIYERALSQGEVRSVMKGDVELASQPVPADKATDVPRDVVLAWTAGKYAQTHDIYFGAAFDDVNTANRAIPLDVLASQGQEGTVFDPAGPLTFGQTYYWRVDEVNAPDKPGTYKGEVWGFTSEPYGYPVKPVKATASSSMASTMGPDKTIDGSGLDAATDEHSVSASQMWLSKKGQSPVWIQYEFDSVYKLHQMWVWNSNQSIELDVGFGAKDVTVETSLDATAWTALADVPELAQATGEPNYVHNTTVDFGGVQAKFVKLTIKSNWADGTKQGGLSEVRFFYVPVKAFGPTPANGGAGAALNAVLNWRPGREAVKHNVTLSGDANAVTQGTAPVKTVTDHSLALGPLGLEYGRTYYWKVTEANDAAATQSWEGDLWSFTTVGYGAVDDFESYNDTCNRVFFSWVDGFGHSGSPDCSVPASGGNGTGSTVGNTNPPFAEKTTIHGGGQSMPMWFDNTKSPFYSETQKEWPTGQDWTLGGANTLTLWVRGDAASFVEVSPGTIIMNGTGTDIWDASDQFRFAYKALKGNGSIVAKVEGVALTNEWAKAGVMIRESAATGSRHAFVAVTPTASHGISYQRRVDTDVATNQATDIADTPVPQWIKLTRNGGTFTAQYSSNGTTWTDIAVSPAVSITMANDVLIGLAVTGHAAGSVCGATFSNVSTTGGVSGAWQVAEVGAAQEAGNTPESFYVALQDSAGKLAVVSHPDKTVIATGIWQRWDIPSSQFTSAGLNLGSIKKMILGIGDRSAPKAGGAGKLYIDDIQLTRAVKP